jgi:hypothetical protein
VSPTPDSNIVYEVHLRSTAGHAKQALFISSKLKRKIIRAGRRSGKTTGVARLAVEQFLLGRRVLYATPTSDQIQKFWFEVKQALQQPLDAGVFTKNETNHTIEKAGTTQRIRAKTAWNADTLRGDYADVLILDEFQLMDEEALGTVGLPMLLDNNGDLVLIYTPPTLESRSVTKAKDPQHAAKMFKKADKENEKARDHVHGPECKQPCKQDVERWLTLHFTSFDNPHLPREGLEEIVKDMTDVAYRQEIMAMDMTDMPGSLWKQAMIDEDRIALLPNMTALETLAAMNINLTRIVVGVDPTGSSTNEAGIVGCGVDKRGHGYVLQDASLLAPSPRAWASASVNCYDELDADVIAGERNYGGDMVKETIHTVDPNAAYKDVTATRGKDVRAQPIVARYQKHIVHHVGQFPRLEEEMTNFVPGQKDSPNRMDACFEAGTMILTDDGEVPIESVTIGMMVRTRKGLCRVLHSEWTGYRPVISRRFPNNRILAGTANHPIYTANRGFTSMGRLRWYDMVQLCVQIPASSEANASRVTLTVPVGISALISLTAKMAKPFSFIGKCGSTIADRFHRAITSITKMTTRFATSCLTLNALVPASTVALDGNTRRQKSPASAGHAARQSRLSLSAKSSVVENAPAVLQTGNADMCSGSCVQCVKPEAFGKTNTKSFHELAQKSAGGSYADVYNLEVEGEHEYFANGVLVHNCVWAFTDLLPQLGVLGLIDYLKDGGAAADLKRESDVVMINSSGIVPQSDPIPKDGCPKCGSTLIQKIGGVGNRCAQCGHQFGGRALPDPVPGRRNLD